MMSALACCLAAAFAMPQDPVRVVSTLRDSTLATVRAHIERVLPDVEVDFQRLDAAELTNRVLDGMPVDVVCGVDVQLCELAAERGDLVSRSMPRTFCNLEHGRYTAPWAVGWVFVWLRDQFETAPATLQDLLDPELEGRIVVPAPRAAPSLWVGWLRARAVAGANSEDQAFGWLSGLDSRVSRYEPTVAAVSAALELGRASLVVLPTDRAVALQRKHGAKKIGIAVPDGGLQLQPLGVALAAESPRAAAAERVFDALFAPELMAELRERHDLFTSDLGALAAELRPWFDQRRLFAPVETAACMSWLARWEEHIRGRGRDHEMIGNVLDAVFTLLFFGVAFVIYRNLSSEEKAKNAA